MTTKSAHSMADKQAPEGVVIVRGAGDGFAQEIAAGSHHFRSDQPASSAALIVDLPPMIC